MVPRIAIVYYSTYGHVAKLAQSEKAGIEAAGGKADLYQIPEILPAEVLKAMYAPPQDPAVPIVTVATLKEYDGFLFGIPTRFGNYSVQWKSFIDSLGSLWLSGALYGKFFGLFVGTGGIGGGQESTAIAALSTWVHQGMVYVPLGYATSMAVQGKLDEARGGSPWGAGTLASGDGSRQPSADELELAKMQGKSFYEQLSKVAF